MQEGSRAQPPGRGTEGGNRMIGGYRESQSQRDTAAGGHMASTQVGVGTEDFDFRPRSGLTFPLCPMGIRRLANRLVRRSLSNESSTTCDNARPNGVSSVRTCE